MAEAHSAEPSGSEGYTGPGGHRGGQVWTRVRERRYATPELLQIKRSADQTALNWTASGPERVDSAWSEPETGRLTGEVGQSSGES